MSVSTGNEMFVISLDIDSMGKATERIPDLEKSAQLHNTLLQGLFPEIRVARLHVPAGVLEESQEALVEKTMKRVDINGTQFRLIGASGSAKEGKFYAVEAKYERAIAERFMNWPQAAITYFGVLVSPCKVRIEATEARVIVVPEGGVRPTTDPRALLRQTLEAHAKAIGRSTCVVAFVERRETSPGGADEMLHVSRFLQSQGLPTVCVDPRELEWRDGEVVHRDMIIDLIYRDFSLHEILSIEQHGGHVEAVKHAFQRNQVVSGLTGEFDHKSLCELLSNPEFDRYFTPSQRRTNRAFIPWTRLLRARKTGDSEGKEIELSSYVRDHRERLVLKPNRAYGGQDVVIGMQTAESAWAQTLAQALDAPNTWVVQERAALPTLEFLDPEEPTQATTEFVTVGFVTTSAGIAFVGRASREPVVNISRGGRLVPVFLIH